MSGSRRDRCTTSQTTLVMRLILCLPRAGPHHITFLPAIIPLFSIPVLLSLVGLLCRFESIPRCIGLAIKITWGGAPHGHVSGLHRSILGAARSFEVPRESTTFSSPAKGRWRRNRRATSVRGTKPIKWTMIGRWTWRWHPAVRRWGRRWWRTPGTRPRRWTRCE